MYRGMMPMRTYVQGNDGVAGVPGNDGYTVVQGNDDGTADGDSFDDVDSVVDSERKDRNNSDSNTPSACPWIDETYP